MYGWVHVEIMTYSKYVHVPVLVDCLLPMHICSGSTIVLQCYCTRLEVMLRRHLDAVYLSCTPFVCTDKHLLGRPFKMEGTPIVSAKVSGCDAVDEKSRPHKNTETAKDAGKAHLFPVWLGVTSPSTYHHHHHHHQPIHTDHAPPPTC